MKKFLNLFMSESDKIISDLIAENDSHYLDERVFEKLISYLQEKDEQISLQNITDALFKKARKVTTWMGTLKALLVFHQLTHTMGPDFVTSFNKQKLPEYTEYKKKFKDNHKALTHFTLAENYHNYLIKLAYNYEDFKVVFGHSTDLYQHLLRQNFTLLHLLSKVQNILMLLLKFDFFFELALLQFPDEPIVKQAAYFILTDCYYYYVFVTNHITAMIDDIFELSADEAIFLYEIYSENIQATKKLKAFMDFKNLLQDFDIQEPAYYKFDAGLNKKVELFINSLKVHALRMRKQEKHFSMGNVESSKPELTKANTFAEGESPQRTLKNRTSLENFYEEEMKVKELNVSVAEKNIRGLSKTILKAGPSSWPLGSQPLSKIVFLPPKRKELDDKKPESRGQHTKVSNNNEPTPDSVGHQLSLGQKAGNVVEASTDKESFKKEGQIPAKLGQNEITKATQPKFNNYLRNQYVPAHDTTVDRSVNESFSDSFINPRNHV